MPKDTPKEKVRQKLPGASTTHVREPGGLYGVIDYETGGRIGAAADSASKAWRNAWIALGGRT